LEKLTLSLLKSSPCFQNLDPSKLKDLAKQVLIKSYEKGETVHHKGDEASGYYGVLSGRIRVSSTSREGKNSTVHFFNQGDWFGEISLIDGLPRTHDAITTEPVQLIVVPKPVFESFLMNDTESLTFLAKCICQRLRMSFQFIEESTTQPLSSRLANRLLVLHPNTHQVSQQELAQMLGVSRQSISKQVLQWEEKGWVNIQYNGITILDNDALAQIAN